jgi:hypothetical protein
MAVETLTEPQETVHGQAVAPRRSWKLPVFLLLLLIVAGALGFWYWRSRPSSELTTQYQAVLLSNGSAYFGRLEGLGTPFPVLRDVFYVQSVKDPQTSAVSNILVKRGKEWHSPDRMILNSNMIVLVEPVNPTSRVSQLISQAKN